MTASSRRRRRPAALIGALVLGLVATACSSRTAGVRPPPSTTAVSIAAATVGKAATPVTANGRFVPVKLQPGERPPQFIVVSFDGVGWHEKWQYWKGIEATVPFHFTGFLSGTYLLSDETKNVYKGPGHDVGSSSINWNSADDLPVEIADLNDALARGDEIGTHYNGHFCSDNPPGGADWDTSDWNDELDQFFGLVSGVGANNGIPNTLKLAGAEIKGGRTPCLEGNKKDLYPAMVAHHMTYDSTFTKHGISWPVKTSDGKIWEIGMAEFPIHGTLPDESPVDPDERKNHVQITMDYNFFYSQRSADAQGLSKAESAKDSAQVKATYDDMFNATFNGNRAPLILGNHFNEWNNNAYSDAIAKFVLDHCGRPEVHCVPFRDLIAWMEAQDPNRLTALQELPPEVKAR